MSNAKILIVDDEPGIRNLVSAYLQKENYEVFEADNGTSAIKAARTFKPNIIILDILIPEMDGLEVLNLLRRESDVYVILLTAKTEETDRIVGLSIGADDYVTKPFSPRELVARVKAALRRLQVSNKPNNAEILAFKHVRIDTGSRQAYFNEKPIDLTPIEFEMLKTLAVHHGNVLSREQLLEHVWGHEYFGETRVVDVHIGHIRQKLDGKYITTIRAIGYRFDDEVIA